ncbi:hypothetical protein ABTL95_20320, partial [Acinetobacter baumannii]
NLIGVPIFTQFSFAMCLFFIAFSFAADYYLKEKLYKRLPDTPYVRYAFNFLGLVMIIMFGIFEKQSFVYFQF